MMQYMPRIAMSMLLEGFLLVLASPGAILISDDLTDGRCDGTASGGTFVAAGWQAGGGTLLYDQKKITTTGGAQIWVTNFDPSSQSTAEKHHFFAGRTSATDNQTSEGSDWWGWRTGTIFPSRAKAFRVLSNLQGRSSLAKQETDCVSPNNAFVKSKTYLIKVKWTEGKVEFFWEGRLEVTHRWASHRTRLVYVGKDIYHGYAGLKGPIYKKVVLWEGEEPAGIGGGTPVAVPATSFHLVSRELRVGTTLRPGPPDVARRSFTLAGSRLPASSYCSFLIRTSVP